MQAEGLPQWLSDEARQRIALYLQNRHREALESFGGWEEKIVEALRPRRKKNGKV